MSTSAVLLPADRLDTISTKDIQKVKKKIYSQLLPTFCKEVRYLVNGSPEIAFILNFESPEKCKEVREDGQLTVSTIRFFVLPGKSRSHSRAAETKKQICIPDDIFVKRRIDAVASAVSVHGSIIERVE